MSVIKPNRTLSKMQFYHNALTLRKQLTLLLLKNFSVKDKLRKIDYYAKLSNLTDEDKILFESLAQKYNWYNVIEEYPKWFLDDCRKNVMDFLRDLMRNIVYANSIYPTTVEEYNERRKYQTRAICCCFHLLQEFQYIISLLPCDLEKYMPYVGMMDEEVKLLKAWRKSDNRFLRAILNKDNRSNSITDKGSDL